MNLESNLIRLRDDIIRLSSPREIILFSEKHNPDGVLSSVKLCAIISGGDSRQTEHIIYVNLESELPFDILVYTVDEWEKLLKNKMSFASQIRRTGRVLYAAD
ncbi:MAG: hypothetical protein PHR24_01615 [Oscillospiraceae bacterium]|nr:hypothetical protein [Oscillospiraceae bacterium]MDD3832392.1 hypothetical protein [Oscillospiraceae bacterium]MDD4545976.1 hypothetical protein [Oscillospiraceae bacterium]